jgi:hypothetical protein
MVPSAINAVIASMPSQLSHPKFYVRQSLRLDIPSDCRQSRRIREVKRNAVSSHLGSRFCIKAPNASDSLLYWIFANVIRVEVQECFSEWEGPEAMPRFAI